MPQAHLTPEQAEQRLKTLPTHLLDWAVKTLRNFAVQVGADAASRMRDDPLGGPRRRDDTGPLRSVTGRFKAGLVKARFRGRQEGVERIVRRRFQAMLIKGSRVPYFATHELGYEGVDVLGRYRNIPARPTLGPAVKSQMPVLRAKAQVELAEEIVAHMRGQTEASRAGLRQ